MKWAVIGIFAVVVLGGVGFAVYKLTDAPEKAQEWWDEKKLDNFEVLANRELDDFEKKIADHKDTLLKLKVDRAYFAGREELGWDNAKVQKTGFWTLRGYQMQQAYRTKQGEALANAYKKGLDTKGTMDSTTGEKSLPADTVISVELPSKDGLTSVREYTAEEVMKLLADIEVELVEVEANAKRVEGVVAEYDKSIADWDAHIKVEEEQLKELRKEVKLVAAEIKIQKAKENLAELNKAINGEGGNSELGKMIRKYEERKTKFKIEELVAADEGKKAKTSVSLDDLDKPAKGGSAPAKSRFIK
ncbi:MAG: hypothetical protein KF754_05150 [Planctomycetes bacterium]|nr:hypothetical protein [Planctomycetota bacterium]